MSEDPPAVVTPPVEAPPVTPPTAEVPWYQSAFKPDGSFESGWQDKVPGVEDYRPMLAQFGDMKSLSKALKDNMSAAREKAAGVAPLSADATPEQIAAYRTAFGIPETPYEMAKPEKLPEGITWDENQAKEFGELAHKLNLTPAQVEALRDYDISRNVGTFTQQAAQAKAEWDAGIAKEAQELKDTFGVKLDSTVLNAQRAAMLLGLPADHMDPKSENFYGVKLLGVFAKMADALGESKLPTIAAIGNMNPLNQARDIVRNNPNYAKDKALQAQVDELYKLAAEQRLS